jgi:hypothetical protein
MLFFTNIPQQFRLVSDCLLIQLCSFVGHRDESGTRTGTKKRKVVFAEGAEEEASRW